MTSYDRYLAKQLAAAVIKILISLVLFFIVVDLLTHRRETIAKYDVPAIVMVKYYLTFIPVILFEYHAAALSMLVASLMVLGRAAQDNEIVAALAGGVSLWRVARAPILVAAALAVGAFVANQTFGVRAVAAAEKIEHEYFYRFDQDNRTTVSWTNLRGAGAEDGLWTCHVLKFNVNAKTGQDVYLRRENAKTVDEIRANRIFWDPESHAWLLEDGRWAVFNQQRDMEQTVKRITQIKAPFDEEPGTLFALHQPAQTKSAAHLRRDLRQAETLGLPVAKYWVDYYAKFARPALCFIMIWLAIPFALRLRRGGLAIGFGLSIVIALAYLLLFSISVWLGHLGELPPLIAAWAANLIFLAVGVTLFRKTPT